ncbi:hypothetical protein YC2023_089733 [Brassica napus]
MAASQISVSELRRGRCARIVVTRLLLFWEARNAKKGGELIELLREGAIYELSGIDVTRSNNHFKLCDFVVSIRLNEFTKMVGVAAVANPIPTEMFRFRSVEHTLSCQPTLTTGPQPHFELQGGNNNLGDQLLCTVLEQSKRSDNDGPKSSGINHGVCDANSVVECGRGEAIEPSNSSDDGRNTSEVAPQKELCTLEKGTD